MKSFFPSYVRAFVKYAQAALDHRNFIRTLSRFAIIINIKANELIKRAGLNPRINTTKLRKEILAQAREFIRKFAELTRMKAPIAIKVAIADDHEVFKQGMETALKFFPDINLIISACNGVDLLEQLKIHKPDVILLDLRMPVMDGLSTLRELKKLYPRIKVLILSMHAESPDVEEALRIGADGYLLKSYDPAIICKLIRASCKPGLMAA